MTWRYSSRIDKMAAELLFCRDKLYELAELDGEFRWLWKIRAKVVNYLVNMYELESVGSFVLDVAEKVIMMNDNPLFCKKFRGSDPQADSIDIERIRSDIKIKLTKLFKDQNQN